MADPFSVVPQAPALSGPGQANPLGFWDTLAVQLDRDFAGPDWLGRNQVNYEGGGIDKMLTALRQRGYKLDDYILGDAREARVRQSYAASHGFTPPPGSIASERAYAAEQAMYGALATERQRDPKFLADMGDVHDAAGLSAWAEKQRAAQAQRDDQQLANSSTAGRIVGGLSYGLSRPENYLLPPMGIEGAEALNGARAVLQGFGRGAAINAGFVAATEPGTIADAHAMGMTYTPGQVGEDIGTAALGGGILEGGGAALGVGYRALRSRSLAAGTAPYRDTVDAFQQAVPPGNRMPAEVAGAHVLNRMSDIAETNPFIPNGPGMSAHVGQLDASTRGLLGIDPAAAAPPGPPVPAAVSLSRDDIIRFTMHDLEGGAAVVHYSQADGGTTKFGIAQRAFPGVDVANLTEGGALALARRYWLPEFDHADPRVAAVAFDANYIHGDPAFARRLAAMTDPQEALAAYRAELNHIADTVPGKEKYRRGWNNRVDKLGRRVGTMSGEPLAAPDLAAVDAPADEMPPPETSPVLDEPRAPEDVRPGWIGDTDGPVLRPDLFATPEAHAEAQARLEAEMRGESASAIHVEHPAAEYGSPENPTPEILSNREFPTPENAVEAQGRLEQRVRRIVDENFDYERLPYNERILLNAARHGGVELVDEHGIPRPAATIARELRDPGDLTTVLKEEVGAAANRPDYLAAAAKERPEVFLGDYRNELAAYRQEHGPLATPPAEHLRDRILARRAGEPLPPPAHDVGMAAPDIDAGAKFIDPDGEGAEMQLESLEHDLRMDAATDKTRYRLTEDGPARTLAQIFEDLDGDDRALAALRACLAPKAAA